MVLNTKPTFWLQVRKEYILDNLGNLLNYLSRYDYYFNEDNGDYDATIECMGQLIAEIGDRINNTPFFKPMDLPVDQTQIIRLLCAHILASHKAGKTPYFSILTLTLLLSKSTIDFDFETLNAIYDIMVNCLRRRKVLNIGVTWNDIMSEEINERMLVYRIRTMKFADSTPSDNYKYIENHGLLVIPPTGLPDLSVANRQKYLQSKYDVIYIVPRLMRVLAANEVFDQAEDFAELFKTTTRLFHMQQKYVASAPASLGDYSMEDCFPIRIISKFGWRMEAETIDPKYTKLTGKILLEMPPKRPKSMTVKDVLNPGDIIMAYRSQSPQYAFEIFDSFEDYYRKYASENAAQERLAIFSSRYANGSEWITEDGMRVGIDKSKEEQLNDDERELFHNAMAQKIPIVVKTYNEAPDINKSDFNVYAEPSEIFASADDVETISEKEADEYMIRNFIDYSTEKAKKFGNGISGNFEQASESECAMLVPVIHRIGNSGQVSSMSRLEYNTAAAMICKMTERKEEFDYIINENRYLYELVQFAADKEVKPLTLSESMAENPEAEKRKEIVETLINYKKKSVIKTTSLLVRKREDDILTKVKALVDASNSLVDIINESELNNIKQTIARMLKVEDEYESILDDRTYYGVESITQEFKSSAVIPPYNRRRSPQDVVDPELQQWALIKAVCGFLNSRSGGDLLIGVNDEGYAAGLEQDMQELYKRGYMSSPDIDHFRLYIQRMMTKAFAEVDGSKSSSEIANTHIDTFPESNDEGRTILRVKVKPYMKKIIRLAADADSRPSGIYDSYVRQSGRTVVITPGMVEEIMKYK